MLVLTRKKGESIQIGGEIELRVLSVQGNRVRLGIEAPATVDVKRGELIFEVDLDSGDLGSMGADCVTQSCDSEKTELACS